MSETVEDVTCVCCLEAIDVALPEYTRMVLPTCRHTFHTACIAQWLIQSHTCPQCRRLVEAERRVQIASMPHHDMGVYWTLDLITTFQAALNVIYHVVVACAHPGCSPDPALRNIMDFNNTMRWCLHLLTGWFLNYDIPRYDAIVASPVINRYLATMKYCTLLQLVSIAGHAFLDEISLGTECGYSVARYILAQTCIVEFVTQYALIAARRDYSKCVSVDVHYTTMLE